MARPRLDAATLQRIIEHAPGYITLVGPELRVHLTNRAVPPRTVDDVIGQPHDAVFGPELSERLCRVYELARETGEEQRVEFFVDAPGGQRQWFDMQVAALQGDAGEFGGWVDVKLDITEQKEAEVQLEKMRANLLEASHRAGMAEVATDVLHNVGHVLTSVHVSAGALAEQVASSHVDMLARVAELCQEQGDDLPEFIAHDSRGRKLPALLSRLGEQLLAERRAVRTELARLLELVDALRSTIEVQQSVAKTGLGYQDIHPGELVDQALSVFHSELRAKSIELSVDIRESEHVLVDEQATLQILVHLIRNAIAALDQTDGPRALAVHVHSSAELVHFDVIDNGCGIAEADLSEIFRHGGGPEQSCPGLYSSAIAARAMGGSLNAMSDGPGRGARFCLSLPRRTAPG